MKKYMFLLLAFCFGMAGCGYNGAPTEYANTCAKENDDKLVEVAGFLDNDGSAMCSSGYGNPMRCPIKFKAALNSEKWMNADIDKGTWSSEIDVYKEGEGLKIKDDKGDFVERAQKLKVTAYVNVLDSPGSPDHPGCYLTVKKIEKAQ